MYAYRCVSNGYLRKEANAYRCACSCLRLYARGCFTATCMSMETEDFRRVVARRAPQRSILMLSGIYLSTRTCINIHVCTHPYIHIHMYMYISIYVLNGTGVSRSAQDNYVFTCVCTYICMWRQNHINVPKCTCAALLCMRTRAEEQERYLNDACLCWTRSFAKAIEYPTYIHVSAFCA